MIKLILSFLSVVFFLLSFLPASSIADNQQKVIFAYEDRIQFPYYMGEGRDIPTKKPGVAVEIVQMLSQKISGLEIELQRYPWKRCLMLLENGAVDGIFNASFKPERLDLGVYPWKDGKVDPSRRITTIAYSLYKRRDSKIDWDNKKFFNLKGKIGAPWGYSIVGDLKKMGIAVDAAEVSETNLDKLLKKRVIGVALQDVTADFYLNAKPKKYEDIVKVEPPIKTKPYYLMLSHQFVDKYPNLAKKVWNTIRILREDKFDKLSVKYFE